MTKLVDVIAPSTINGINLINPCLLYSPIADTGFIVINISSVRPKIRNLIPDNCSSSTLEGTLSASILNRCPVVPSSSLPLAVCNHNHWLFNVTSACKIRSGAHVANLHTHLSRDIFEDNQ